jgi:hypothetical protein
MRVLALVGLLAFASWARPNTKGRRVELPKGTVVFPEEWFACDRDNQCTYAVGPRECWKTMVPINKRFEKSAVDKMSPLCGGKAEGGVLGAVAPACVAHQCRVRSFDPEF